MKGLCGVAVLLAFVIGAGLAGHAEEELLIFAVVSEVPKDKSRVAVKASVNDVATDVGRLEPVETSQRLRRPCDPVADRLVDGVR